MPDSIILWDSDATYFVGTTFWEAGVYNGWPYYVYPQTGTPTRYIWCRDASPAHFGWLLAASLGDELNALFVREATSPEGDWHQVGGGGHWVVAPQPWLEVVDNAELSYYPDVCGTYNFNDGETSPYDLSLLVGLAPRPVFRRGIYAIMWATVNDFVGCWQLRRDEDGPDVAWQYPSSNDPPLFSGTTPAGFYVPYNLSGTAEVLLHENWIWEPPPIVPTLVSRKPTDWQEGRSRRRRRSKGQTKFVLPLATGDQPVELFPWRPAREVHGKATDRRNPIRSRVIVPPMPGSPLIPPWIRLSEASLLAGRCRPRRRSVAPPSRLCWPHRKVVFYLDARGLYRVFNDAEYRFYRSTGTPPVEGSTPFATSSSLPHTPAETYADGTWFLSVSYFNGVLDSGFLPLGPHGETFLTLTLSSGIDVGLAPAGPLDWRLESQSDGVVRIIAIYFERSARASEWAIAYTLDGNTPAVDDPDLTEDISASGISILSYDLPAAAAGVVVKVRLQTRRDDGLEGTPAWRYSAASTVLTLTIPSAGPTAPVAAEDWPGVLQTLTSDL